MRKPHVIVTASGTVSVRQYVQTWRSVKAADAGTRYKSSLCGWWPATREEILAQFWEGLDDRINRHIAGYGKGRKWDADWQRAARNTATSVNTPRLIVRWVPAEFRQRLAHRLEQ